MLLLLYCLIGSSHKPMVSKTLTLYIFLFFCISLPQAYSQNYGLRFSGQSEPVSDNRTSLDLSAEGPICTNGNFELSFKLGFLQKSKAYFGYVLRMVDNHAQNIDLMMYDNEHVKTKNLRIIIGEHFSKIIFTLDSNLLFNQWNTLKLKFNRSNNTLSLSFNGKELTEKNVNLSQSGCFKMLFGANTYNQFKTTDVPDMRLKDVLLTEDGKQTYSWPLDEISGNVSADIIQQTRAKVVNPRWIKSIHYNWEKVDNFVVKGNASVAFDAKTENLHVVSSTALYSYSVLNGKQQVTNYKNGKFVLLQGNQSIFDTLSGKLYNLNVDKQKVAAFNFVTKEWDNQFDENERITKYWHVNKFVSDVDQSLYVLGGYGELTYKNLVQRGNFTNSPWKEVSADSLIYGPRYLSALGTAAHTGYTYIVGGYGSLTGSQMLNPHNYYDLIRFNVKDKTFKSIYKLDYPENDFAFANSLVIDQKANTFYGLIFSNQKFNSTLQLIKGSLIKPSYQLVGDKIPYQFFDIKSFADLYYCPTSKKLIAVTLFRKTDTLTEVKIYTIGFPPNMLSAAPQTVSSNWSGYVWLGVGFLVIIGGAVVLLRKKSSKKVNPVVPDAPALVTAISDMPVNAVPTEAEVPVPVIQLVEQPLQKSALLMFGNLEVTDKNGNSITRLFTPLLKELFLLILVYSIRRKTGVSSEKLNEILWFDKSKKDALNNRSVNIARLKTILEELGDCHLSKVTGYWKIETDYSQIHVDYHQYLQIVDTKQVLSKLQIEELFNLIQRGSFMLDTDYEWLDEFKAEVTNQIIDRLLLFARSVDMTAEPDILIQTTNHIFHFDPVNEDAMEIQCKVLALLGKHSVSKSVYEKFVKEYHHIYGENYNRSFNSIIE